MAPFVGTLRPPLLCLEGLERLIVGLRLLSLVYICRSLGCLASLINVGLSRTDLRQFLGETLLAASLVDVRLPPLRRGYLRLQRNLSTLHPGRWSLAPFSGTLRQLLLRTGRHPVVAADAGRNPGLGRGLRHPFLALSRLIDVGLGRRCRPLTPLPRSRHLLPLSRLVNVGRPLRGLSSLIDVRRPLVLLPERPLLLVLRGHVILHGRLSAPSLLGLVDRPHRPHS